MITYQTDDEKAMLEGFADMALKVGGAKNLQVVNAFLAALKKTDDAK